MMEETVGDCRYILPLFGVYINETDFRAGNKSIRNNSTSKAALQIGRVFGKRAG